MIPMVAVLAGMAFLGEQPSAAELGGLALVLASLATVLVPARGARR
jgi:drug/metabolite transporter (DMT)-like permease